MEQLGDNFAIKLVWKFVVENLRWYLGVVKMNQFWEREEGQSYISIDGRMEQYRSLG